MKVWRQRAPVTDEVDGAAHVDVHKVNIGVFLQQLSAPSHGVRIPATHLFSNMHTCV